MGVWSGRVLPFLASYIWSFSIPQSMSFRRSLRRLAVVLAFGASSIFWKATAMIIRAQMLMCHKVTRKNLIDSSPLFPCNKEKAMYRFTSEWYNTFRAKQGEFPIVKYHTRHNNITFIR